MGKSITWSGGDNSAVTLTLRRGYPKDLNTVSTIANAITANYYVWTVPSTLASADDYALQISQGSSDINYSGLFSIQGGSGNSTTASGQSSMSITSMVSGSGTSTVMYQNTTFSSASLTSSGSASFGATTSRSSSSRTAAATTQATSAPSNDAPIRTGSSAALILGIVAAVMLH